MKKYFNETHDVVLETRLVSKVKEAKDGDLVPHLQKVERISFFEMAENGTWQKVYMSKDAILDIAAQIKEIESQTIDAHVDLLPF